MKCGVRGHKTVTGQPCQQTIGARAKGCVLHTRTAAERSLLATKGGIASRMRRGLPSSYHIPEFDSPKTIKAVARDLAHLALTGDVELRRLSEARGLLSIALSACQVESQAQLVDALLRMEHGGVAFAFLARLQDGLEQGRSRPLPGRALAIAEGEAS